MNQRNNLTSIKIVRITESDSIATRCIYRVADYLDTFSLIECRNKVSVNIQNCTETLILDHLDEAHDSKSIIQEVLNSNVTNILIVDSQLSINYEFYERATIGLHLYIGDKNTKNLKKGDFVIGNAENACNVIKRYLVQVSQ